MTDARQPIVGAGEKCPDFEALSCFTDGELEGAALAAVESHVAQCGRCAGLAARLRDGFEADDARLDGGIGGSGCAGEELLVLYASDGLQGSERVGIDAHLAGCDACVRAVAMVRLRLGLAPEIATPVPLAVQRRAEAVLAPVPELAAERPRVVAQPSRPRLLERITHLLRMPVLVPVAAAAAMLLAVNVMPRGDQPSGERTRAISPSAVSMRVRAVEAPVHARPSMNSAVVAKVTNGTTVTVAGSERDWYEVQLDGGKSGWVLRDAFE